MTNRYQKLTASLARPFNLESGRGFSDTRFRRCEFTARGSRTVAMKRRTSAALYITVSIGRRSRWGIPSLRWRRRLSLVDESYTHSQNNV